jgi:hypothetical protein
VPGPAEEIPALPYTRGLDCTPALKTPSAASRMFGTQVGLGEGRIARRPRPGDILLISPCTKLNRAGRAGPSLGAASEISPRPGAALFLVCAVAPLDPLRRCDGWRCGRGHPKSPRNRGSGSVAVQTGGQGFGKGPPGGAVQSPLFLTPVSTGLSDRDRVR